MVLETGALVLGGTRLGTNLKTAISAETKGCRAGTVGTMFFDQIQNQLILLKENKKK